ncbi:hypothetical protein V6N13_120204 [Hibiscus sabdariffa]
MVESALVIHGVYMDLSHDVRKLTVFGDDLMIYLLIGRPQFGQSKGRTKADEPVPSEKRITYFCLSLWTTAGNEIDGVYKVAILNRNTPFLLVLFWKKLPQLAETSIERVEKNSYILSNSSYRNNLDEIVLGAVTSLYWSSASELGFRFSLPFLNDLYEGFFLDITLNLRLLF